MAGRVSVPGDVAALKLLDRVDYQDAFAAETSAHHSAEHWARLCFEVDPPVALLIPALVLAPFGLATKQTATTRIGGLQILRNDPDNIVLGFNITLGTPRIVFSAQPGRLVMSTLLRLNGRAGRVAWSCIAPLHRITARSLVDHAAKVAAQQLTRSGGRD